MQTTVQEHITPSKTQAKTKAFVAPAPVILRSKKNLRLELQMIL